MSKAQTHGDLDGFVVSTTLSSVHDDVDTEDPTSADLLHAIIGSFEQKAWMLRSESLER